MDFITIMKMSQKLPCSVRCGDLHQKSDSWSDRGGELDQMSDFSSKSLIVGQIEGVN